LRVAFGVFDRLSLRLSKPGDVLRKDVQWKELNLVWFFDDILVSSEEVHNSFGCCDDPEVTQPSREVFLTLESLEFESGIVGGD
jgi:hypothetical protein